jgi:hypothetical protein
MRIDGFSELRKAGLSRIHGAVLICGCPGLSRPRGASWSWAPYFSFSSCGRMVQTLSAGSFRLGQPGTSFPVRSRGAP